MHLQWPRGHPRPAAARRKPDRRRRGGRTAGQRCQGANGGRDLIRVTDDGHGIAFDELALAVAPHATSKISSTGDLDAIATLGFRGEALASLASVSRMSVVSRQAGAEEAGRIDVEGERVTDTRPAPGPPGTTVTVHNLFFNTPARRKFLRTDTTETGRITQAVEALALGHPRVGFTLAANSRRTLELPPDEAPRQRMLSVLGRELEPELLDLSAADAGVTIHGLAGRPDLARGTTRHQHVFINGRPISDRAISHAVKEAYRGLIDPARHPTIVVFMEIDPRQVDVNVHPTKAQVRFRNPSLVHGAVLHAIRGALSEADLTPEVSMARAAVSAPFGSGLAASPPATPADFVEHFRRLDPRQKGFVYSEVKQALETGTLDAEILPAIRPVQEVLQVHSSYLVTQDEQGLLIIDQHALHERVMFETLIDAVCKGNLESQRLLMPAMIEVDPAQVEQLETLQPLLRKIGIEAEPAGPAAIAVHAFSSFLFERHVEPPEFISDLLNRVSGEGLGDDPEAALHETLDMMACKAAVKAGDRLSDRELAELLAHRERVERSSSCPHGRPTTLRLTIRDLERQFGRR
ncbi:MAG: DNA mismatch repair endonuclease MutL [Planctomycetota bacterium]